MLDLIFTAWLVLGLSAAWLVASHYLPLPPEKITISTGPQSGSYRVHGQAYAEALRERGFEVELVPSVGSIENLERLGTGKVDASFLQNGTAAQMGKVLMLNEIELIATVSSEPVWIFSTLPHFDTFSEIKDARIALGPIGSGSYAVARDLFRLDQVALTDLRNQSRFDGTKLAQQFANSEVDLAIITMSPSAELVQKLLKVERIKVVELPKVGGLASTLPYYEILELQPSQLGVNTLGSDGRITLLAVSTSMAVRKSLHPAVKRLLADATRRTHSKPASLGQTEGFPHQRSSEFARSIDAQSVLETGLPWLESRLPVRWAYAIYQIMLVWLPFFVLSYVLHRLLSSIRRTITDEKILRLQGAIKYIELDVSRNEASGLQLSASLRKLTQLDTELIKLSSSNQYLKQLNELRAQVSALQFQIYSIAGR